MGTSSSKNKVQKGGKLVIGMNRLKGEFVSTEHFSYYTVWLIYFQCAPYLPVIQLLYRCG